MRIRPSFREWYVRHAGELDAVVLDIDGVLCLDHKPLPGARALVGALRAAGTPFSLLTNDGNHSKRQKCAFLKACGVVVSEAQIVSCGDGLLELGAARKLAGKLFFVLGDLGRPCYAEAAGLRVTRRQRDLPRCAGIIIGEDNYDWEPNINAAVNHCIRRPATPLIVPNPDEYYGVGPSTVHVAAGGVARFIRRVLRTYGVRVDPVYLGKPHQPIFRHHHGMLERKLGGKVRRARVVLVGDSLASDIRGANRFGYQSALVLTGVTNPDMLRTSRIRPDMVFRGL